jgi:hypothetical protein
MAGTTIPARADAMPEGTTRQVRLEFNKLVDDLETLRAAFATLVTKMNLDAGITDTNYASVLAASLTAAKVANQDGATTA